MRKKIYIYKSPIHVSKGRGMSVVNRRFKSIIANRMDFDDIERKITAKKRSVCVRLPTDLIEAIKKQNPKIKLTVLILELLNAYHAHSKKKNGK